MSKYETSASLEQLLQHRDELFNVMKVKNLIDFSLFFLGLVLFYGGDGDFYESLALLEKELNCKYGKNIPFNKLSLCLWTLDMSFVQKMDDPLENSNEHLALLNAMRSINQETKVTASIDSRLWARDIIAWIDTEFTLFVQSVHDDSCNQFGCGLLSEGGNIVTGNAVNRFILIAQGPFVNQTDEVEFYYEMEKRDIKTYTLPDGFLWARNPETKIDILLDSIHIDTVINIIPSQCTLDERVKIIIDPYYFALIKENGEFKRFIKEQSIVDDDIVIVDERELYLNLPNFSVIIDQRGEQKLLFNKEHGYTLPRLKIKEKKIVQPVVEIANISSYFGTIRCATNMLPLRLISNLRSLTISVCENCPKETKLQVLNQIQIFENRLCSLWISNLKIIIGQSEGDYEFDDLLRIIFIYLPSDRINDPAICSSIVNDCLLRFIEKNNHYFGL